jgi:outer membrane receptor protein involved in Fe transport
MRLRMGGVLAALVRVGVCAALAAAVQAQQLEEVVVTAQKREQRLQDVPIAVNSISGAALQAQTLVEMEALSVQLPNMHISESAIGDKLFIRGIGSGINAGFEQSVGMFIDGVYHGRSLQTRSQFLDIERVEVLRGPQSTFFGYNTIAGALNITTRGPTEELSGYVTSFHETEHHEYHVEGAASGALSDTLALRVAGLASGLDGWVTNLNTGQSEGDEKNRAGRTILRFTPNGVFDAALKLETGRFDVLGRNLQVQGCPPATGALGTCALLTAPVLAAFGPAYAEPLFADFDDEFDLYTQYNGPVPERFTAAVDTLGALEAGRAIPPPAAVMSARDHGELANQGATLTLNWQLARHQLTAISGLSSYAFAFRQTSDFQPLPNVSVRQDEDFRQFTQEVRLTSASDTAFEYMLGLYYHTSELEIDEGISLYMPPPYFQPASTWFTDACRQSARSADPRCRLPATIAGVDTLHRQHDDALAAFAAFTWEMTPVLRATLGARHTIVEKDLARSQGMTDRAPGITVACPSPVAAQLGCVAGAPLLLTAHNPPQGRAFGWGVGALDLSRRDSRFTPSVTLQWDAGDAIMLYGSYAEGFKAGGFDHRNLFLDPVSGQFDPEAVQAWEVGMKSTLLDGTMQLNVALFRSYYANLQVSTFDGVVNFLVNNAASARSQGVETDLRWRIGDNWMLGGAVAFLDANWRNYRDAQCRAIELARAPTATATCTIDATTGLLVQDLSGAEMLMSPAWSGNVSLEHHHPLRAGLALESQLLVYFQDAKYLAADNDPATLQPGFAKVNLRVAVVSDSGWELALVGRNLTDELTSTHAEDMPLSSANSFFRLTDRPRTLALQAQYLW